MKSAVELRAAFAARELSPVEVIDGTVDEFGAFVTPTLERARDEARAAERAYTDGTARALEGLPLAVKDLFDTEGVPTSYGSPIFAGHVPDADAEAVRRARAAGAIVVGKTLTHEFAWGITSNNPHYPPCRNPWDPERVPGGSSGGSAVALASGAAALALGSDTGGSIRIPAAFCGVSGLKPTYSRIPVTGVFPLARSLDHVGPMAVTPADVRLFYEVLAGPVELEPAPRIAICPDLHLGTFEPAIGRVFDRTPRARSARSRSPSRTPSTSTRRSSRSRASRPHSHTPTSTRPAATTTATISCNGSSSRARSRSPTTWKRPRCASGCARASRGCSPRPTCC